MTPDRPPRPRLGATVAAVVLLGMAGPAGAGFIDFDPSTPERETASWAEPGTIKVYIPAGLAGADRMNFEMGIRAWDDCLTAIMVMFADGEPPGDEGVNVDLCPPGSIVDQQGQRRFGVAFPEATFQDGQLHGRITSALLKLDMEALGSADFLKNLGAHEFGHVLGLDEDPRGAGTARSAAMDPDFDATSPFVGPSARDKMMLMEHYSVAAAIPEPPTLATAAVGLLGVAGLWRAGRRRAPAISLGRPRPVR